MSTPTRLAVMAHYHPLGEVGPHVRRQVAMLAETVDDVVLVTTSQLTDSARAFLAGHGQLIERTNYGYDFFSYKTGLEARDLGKYDEVTVCNDTFVGGMVPLSTVYATMATRPVDVWGLSESLRIEPHLQSFFVTFRPWVVESQTFRQFWGEMTPVSDRKKVIKAYEIGMSANLVDAGFRYAAYFSETEHDRKLARRRVKWWARHRVVPAYVQDREAFFEEARNEPWNPSIGLADCALDGGRLPFVKLDTLRYDPYGLNAGKLLTLCERRFPDAFDGVRAFLAETAPLYPPRKEETLKATPALLNALRPLVEYHDAS